MINSMSSASSDSATRERQVAASSGGRKHTTTPRREGSTSLPRAASSRAMRRVGIWVISPAPSPVPSARSEEHTSELQSQSNLVCRLLLEKKKKKKKIHN